MAIRGISNLRLNETFKAKTTTGDSTIRIGRNAACIGISKNTEKFRSLLEAYESDLEAIVGDRNLSAEGREKKRLERSNRFRQETEPILAETAEKVTALRREAEGIRAKVRGKFEAKDIGDKVEASEYRALLRAMPAEKRSGVIISAAARKDPAILRALHSIPDWDDSILGSAPMRKIIRNAIETAELQDLTPLDVIAVDNAEELADISMRKLAAFAEETERITKDAVEAVLAGGAH